ncbi:Histone deacetylase superfamily [Alloalcanivorax dieselolei B5]|uniref:Histone deacetylase superfamily n=1 Tax=Alcanivorax dieselolei (strain DSM 16502 / CGMCC 1.3690 / MCCC 1A00001 / B-5) TaxID=930169 RepID=K0C7Y6_ALCDB|nr:class II histone deacetylase [Alloalcanivorax dieselolei]AFT68630.1 Histone deacetylase superfamily [Alloalcanivorax dieselolei B5]GGK05753.1 class II histone deacetylase [Alloalcanivorax dieselolei]
MTIGYMWDTLYGWVDTGTGSLTGANLAARLQPISHHLAHPDTKRRFHELISTSGQLDHMTPIKPLPARDEDILRVHTGEHLENVRRVSALEHGGDAGDGVTYLGNGGLEIAMLAAGGAIQMVKSLVQGDIDSGYALVNPPGHHAPRDGAMGFCIFNNTSVAAAYARDKLGLDRVAIVDWDVHHGNGTQDIWWEDPSVLTISLHQHLCFPPESGYVGERGAGKGHGYNLNVPMPPGCGNGAYLYAMETVVLPALQAFRPQLIIVGCGFDASIMDPLARMMVTSEGFRAMARRIIDSADELCEGRILFVQEGGYSPHYVPFCGLAVIQELTGKRALPDPYLDFLSGMGGAELLDEQRTCIDGAEPLIESLR